MSHLPATLTDVLQLAAETNHGLTYIDAQRQSTSLAYAALLRRAQGLLHHYQRLGMRPGDKLILMLSRNEQFVDAFWAAVLGGIVPVPLAVAPNDQQREKLLQIHALMEQPYLCTDDPCFDKFKSYARSRGQKGVWDDLQTRTVYLDHVEAIDTAGQPHCAAPDDLALIQFTSGATQRPRGVMLTHANLIHNLDGSRQAGAMDGDDRFLGWMPLTHDMGLIGYHLMPMLLAVPQVLMETALFIRRPQAWLQLAAEHRATILGAPNFGYALYLKRQQPDASMDLSSVRLIFNGAEPISVPLARRFTAALAASGLAANSLYPVYGLAEASLAVSFPKPGDPLRAVWAARDSLLVGTEIKLLEADTPGAVEFACLGTPIPYGELRLVDDADAELPPGRLGHIQIRGANVTAGYYRDAQATTEAISADGWLRTGDLGFLIDGQLVVTGRSTDLIIVHGQNAHPHDLEQIAAQVDGVAADQIAVCGVRAPDQSTDTILAFVQHRGDRADFASVAAAVAARINAQTGLAVDAVVPVRRLPRTTSGKLQRAQLAQRFQDGEFEAELEALDAQRASVSAQPATSDRLTSILLGIYDQHVSDHQVNADDSIFDMGLNSLTLAHIFEAIDERWPGVLEPSDFVDHPSVSALAKYLKTRIDV